MKKISVFIKAVIAFLILCPVTMAQEKIIDEVQVSPEDLVRNLYEYVSVEKGESYNWDRFQTGLDSMHLIKVEGEWQIISIINEIPTPDRPLPEFLRN
jgi:hypothetical protein